MTVPVIAEQIKTFATDLRSYYNTDPDYTFTSLNLMTNFRLLQTQ